MNDEYFKLESSEEVKAFDELLRSYEKHRCQFEINYISLPKIFDIFQQHATGGRLFTALLDIRLNFCLLNAEFYDAGVTWNQNFSKGKLEGGTILDSRQKFFGKMDLLRYLTEYIHRYRALGDKIMGFLVLLFHPDKYDDYCRAKSRRKYFMSVAPNTPEIESEIAESISKTLNNFDNRFRTSEVHGTGSLRKWMLSMESVQKNPQIELIDYWNTMLKIFVQIQSMIEPWHHNKLAQCRTQSTQPSETLIRRLDSGQ